ncbi:hypothetical protein WN944_027685 [Citrus x changshan-huyou]|uniref:Uncharacterized protein n=1 Tax=Citrus x changshan-huyou TaxID=2935761 RepID=A0AAP0LJ31_9ROSI
MSIQCPTSFLCHLMMKEQFSNHTVKTKNPTITTLLSIGGGNADYSTYSSSEKFFIYEILYLHFSSPNANATDRPTILIFYVDPIRRIFVKDDLEANTNRIVETQSNNFGDVCNYSVPQRLHPSWENPNDRPSMLEVYSMLENENTAEIMTPKKLETFSKKAYEDEQNKATIGLEIRSSNDAKISQLVGR